MGTLSAAQMDTLVDLAEQFDGEVRAYSGRGMYGEQCLGVTIDGDLIGFAMNLAACLAEEGHFDVAESLAAQACTDSLGRGSILYFPRTAAPGEAAEEDEF
jgi:hypothetical protein